MTKHLCPRGTRALLPALAAAACSSPSSSLDGDLVVDQADNLAAHDGEGIRLLVQLEDLEAYPEALYEGGLDVDASACVRLERAEATTVLWPKGFSGRRSGGEIEILDAQGAVVGTTGDVFCMGGGGVPTLHEGVGFTEADQALAVARCPGGFLAGDSGDGDDRLNRLVSTANGRHGRRCRGRSPPYHAPPAGGSAAPPSPRTG